MIVAVVFAAIAILATAPGVGAQAPPGVRAQAPPDLSLGRRVFAEHCAICHGTQGDGRGHAAHHFATLPRDLTAGRFKVRSTGSGQLPTDDDLARTIVRGLPGTGMVPQDHLGETELRAVITFIKTLSPRFATAPPPAPLPIPSQPAASDDAPARGRQVYLKAECQECHGREGRGDGPSAKDLKTKPTDLTRRPFKGGSEPRDIVRTVLTGFDGTPMPAYHLLLSDAELWDLARYVASLGSAPEPTPDERAGWHVVRMHQHRSPR
jgi:mono/diheme cytochrome c family protein